MEWEGSSDCSAEYKAFNDCIAQERRRYAWQEVKPPMYEYIMNRLEEKRKEKKYLNILKPDEIAALEQLNDQRKIQEGKMVEKPPAMEEKPLE
jgi:hypothetical protein